MKGEKLVTLLRQIEKLVAECLQAAGEKAAASARRGKALRPEKLEKNALTERILELRDKGFFPRPKKGREVQAKLNPTYACEVDRVMMALLRLKKRKQLRKTSKSVDGKKQVAYVW
jgi:hypothetical protein